MPNHLNQRVVLESGTGENTTHVAVNPRILDVIFNLAKLRNTYFGCNLILFYGSFQTEILGGGLYCIFLASAAPSMHISRSIQYASNKIHTHLLSFYSPRSVTASCTLHVNNSGSWESNKIYTHLLLFHLSFHPLSLLKM